MQSAGKSLFYLRNGNTFVKILRTCLTQNESGISAQITAGPLLASDYITSRGAAFYGKDDFIKSIVPTDPLIGFARELFHHSDSLCSRTAATTATGQQQHSQLVLRALCVINKRSNLQSNLISGPSV